LIENPERFKRFNSNGMMIKNSKGLKKEFGDILKGLSRNERKKIINKARSAYGNNVTEVVTNLSGYTKSGRAISSFVNENGNFKTGIAPAIVADKYNLLTPEQKKLVGKRLGLQKSLTEQINELRNQDYSKERDAQLQKLLNLRTKLPSISQKRAQFEKKNNNQKKKSEQPVSDEHGYASPNPHNEYNKLYRPQTQTTTPTTPTTPPTPSQIYSRLIHKKPDNEPTYVTTQYKTPQSTNLYAVPNQSTITKHEPAPTFTDPTLQLSKTINSSATGTETNESLEPKPNTLYVSAQNIKNLKQRQLQQSPPPPPLPERQYLPPTSKTFSNIPKISNDLKNYIQGLNTKGDKNGIKVKRGILATEKMALLNYLSGQTNVIPANIINDNLKKEIENLKIMYNGKISTNDLVLALRQNKTLPQPQHMKSNLVPTKIENLTKSINSRLHDLIPKPTNTKYSEENKIKYIEYLKNADLQDLRYSLPMTIDEFIKQQ
jgi:hypothetical protein